MKRFLFSILLVIFLGSKNLQAQSINPFNDLLISLNNTATISGKVYLDVNGNGIQDIEEPGIENIGIIIINSNNSGQSTLTDFNGDWNINVPAGETIIFVATNTLPLGAVLTSGNVPNNVTAVNDSIINTESIGYFQVGELQGKIYLDINGNGTQDPGETGISNVEVVLTDEFGNSQSVFTNNEGFWLGSVGIGNVTSDINQNDPNFPTGATQTEGTDPTVTFVEAGQLVFSENDGFFPSGSISGTLYFDSNGNGTQDSNENGIPNITILIEDAFGNTTLVETDTSGNWSALIAEGEATVVIDENQIGFPSGAIQTQGTNPTSYIIDNGQSYNQLDGFFEFGSIEGRIYFDENGNGIQDANENGIPGIVVDIFTELGTTTQAITDTNGDWFAELPLGETTTNINLSQNPFPTYPIQTEGTNPTISVILANQTVTEIDGFTEGGLLEGVVYLDENNNGTQDPEEPGIGEIDVSITDSNNSINTVQTNANGEWSIILPVGNAVSLIDELHPNFPLNAVQTEGTNPTTSNITAGQITDEIDGYYVLDEAESELTAKLYFDLNGNGIQDPNEPNMPNIEVTVLDSNGIFTSVSTNELGIFSLQVPAGSVTYTINTNDPDFPTGAVQTEGTNPTTLIAIGGETTFGGNNGFFVPDEDELGELFAHLYFDLNGNGIQDPNEPDMPNVDVTVIDNFGNTQIVTTNANGDFFATIPAGEAVYDINQNDPDFPTGAIQTEGTDPTFVFVLPNTTTFGGNNGFFVPDEDELGELFAHLYFDLNGNGIQDPNEPDMPNVDVTVIDNFGNTQIVTTNANGDFFATIPAGEAVYDINQNDPDFPTGAIQTEGTDPTFVFVLPNTTTFGGNNGFFVPDEDELGELFAHLYFDLNGNGIQDPNEPDMPNVDVTVIDNFGNTQIVTTNANGDFFATIPAGEAVYDINQNDPDFPTGAIQTEGTDPTFVFVLPNTTTFGGNNGFFVPDEDELGELFAHLYFDLNGNGIQDPNEPNMPNVDVTVIDNFGNTQIVTTNANGDFFATIPAGEAVYDINQNDPDFPTGAIQTEGTDPTFVFVLPNTTTFGGNNGFFVPDEDEQGILTAKLYFDINGNGTQDFGEPNMPNIEVFITDNFGTTQSVFTNANGIFIASLPAGNALYEINTNDPDFPTGAIQTEGTNPTNIFVAPNLETFGGNNGFFDISNSETDGLLTGLVYLDANANGTFDPDENGLPNVNVIVIDSNGELTNIQTNENGIFSIIIPEGFCLVEVSENLPDFPIGAILTDGNNPIVFNNIAGQVNTTPNFGYFNVDENITAEISGLIYLDENGNGILDPNENGIEGVEVTIEDALGNTQIAITNNDGVFLSTVIAGNSVVTINESTPPIPADAIQTEGINPTSIFALPNITNSIGNNGYFVPSDANETLLTGHLYIDENGNGNQDNDEPNLVNVEVNVEDSEGNTSTVTTDANGDFSVIVSPGDLTYEINEDGPNFPADAIQTEGTNPTTLIAIAGIENFGGNNGFFVPNENTTSSINGRVYFDANGNGTQDEDEVGIAELSIFVTDALGSSQTIVTDVNGDFITEVIAGSIVYEIDESDPNFPVGAIQTEGVNPTTLFAVPNENTFAGNNGYFVQATPPEPANIISRWYLDVNGNGVLDAGEPFLVNVDVFVSDDFGNEQIVTTNANGFSVAQVLAGNITFEIDENHPNFPIGAIQTQGTNPTTVFVAPNTTLFPGNNGFFVPSAEITVEINGNVYFDENGNGTQDTGEEGIAEVEVEIIDGIGNLIQILSNENGSFSAIVAAGQINVQVNESSASIPENAILTEGTNPFNEIILPFDDAFVGNYGFFVPEETSLTITGFVYFDENGNGIQDNGEIGLEGIAVDILDGAGNSIEVFTDATGIFSAEVEIGTVFIEVDETSPNFPEGAIITEGENPLEINIDILSDPFIGNFGYFVDEEEIDPTDPEEPEEPEEDGIRIFNAASPNGSGQNQFFRIEGLSEVSNTNVQVFNREGVKVYDVDNYGFGNNLFRGISEGRITFQKNKILPTGTYFYLLRYTDEDGIRQKKQGYLYLIN